MNVSYDEGERQKLDVYGVNLPNDAPIVVFMHGGYWQGMNKFTSSYAIKPFVDAGIKVIVVDHDLCPDIPLSEVVKQFRKASEFIINEAFMKKAKSISFVGHLSGAHLITLMLEQKFIDKIGSEKFKLIKNVVLISGIYDLNELKDVKCANRDNLLSLDSSNVDSVSPAKQTFDHLNNFSIKFFLFVGSDESPTLQQQSNNMKDILGSSRLNAEFREVENCDHFNIVEKLSESDYEITKIIVSNI